MKNIDTNSELSKLGYKLKEARKSRGYTQKALAKKLQITERTYSDYENNYKIISLESLSTLSKLLGCSISSFFDSTSGDNIVLQLSGQIEIKRINSIQHKNL